MRSKIQNTSGHQIKNGHWILWLLFTRTHYGLIVGAIIRYMYRHVRGTVIAFEVHEFMYVCMCMYGHIVPN